MKEKKEIVFDLSKSQIQGYSLQRFATTAIGKLAEIGIRARFETSPIGTEDYTRFFIEIDSDFQEKVKEEMKEEKETEKAITKINERNELKADMKEILNELRVEDYFRQNGKKGWFSF